MKAVRPYLISIATGVLAWTLVLSGCAGSNPYPGGSLERATTFRDQGKNQEAVDAFGMFLRSSPTDSMAAWAQLEKGRCYMEMGEYPLAVVEFQILRQEYPTSEYVEDAIFLEAKAYLDQVGNIRRDISPAYNARVRFMNFIEMYPMSVYAPDARDALIDIGDLMARKALGTVDTYFGMHEFEAAAIVLDRLMVDEPNTRLRDEILLRRAETALKLDDAPTATDKLEQLLANYPESRFAPKARRMLDRVAEKRDR